MNLGIDVGRVLISPGDESKPDTSFIGGSHDDAMRTPPYPGMFELRDSPGARGDAAE